MMEGRLCFYVYSRPSKLYEIYSVSLKSVEIWQGYADFAKMSFLEI